MTIKQLRAAFKRANKRVDKTVTRYERLLFKLYMPLESGEIVNVFDKCYRGANVIPEPATQLSWEFYRRGRNGEFYEKPQPCPCLATCGIREIYGCRDCKIDHADGAVGQDYLDLCRMEAAINAAVDERKTLLTELENAGLNPWTDDDLWK